MGGVCYGEKSVLNLVVVCRCHRNGSGVENDVGLSYGSSLGDYT